MSPPIQKDWWLAAALAGAALPAAMGQAAIDADGRQTGVVTAVTQGAPTTDASTPIYIDNTRGQRLVTGPNQTLHVLFSDQSAITLGPNSEAVIAEYRYDSETKDGNLSVDLTRGVLRVVGGFISKKNETVVRTSTATVAIRGGITMVEHQDGKTSAHFLFGQFMRMSSPDGGQEQFVTRQGFGAVSENGQISEPRRVPPSEFSSLLGQFGTPGQGNPAPSPGPAPQPVPAPPAGDLPPAPPVSSFANDRVPGVQDPSQVPNINPTEALRNVLGTGATPNQS